MSLPSGFHIRLARKGDGELLRDVMLRGWAGTVAENSSAYRETAEGIERELEAGGAAILFEGEAAIGAGRFHPVPGPAGDARTWAEIKRVGVLKTHRKQGLAAPLIATLEGEIARRSAAGVQIGVRHDQPRLVAFWEGIGYRLADDVKLHTVNPLTPTPTFLRKWF